MVGASVATHFWHLRTFPLESLPFRRLWQAPVAQRLEQQTHNLLVRGSNPCGGTNQLASVLTLTSSCGWANSCSTSRCRKDGAILLGVRGPVTALLQRDVDDFIASSFQIHHLAWLLSALENLERLRQRGLSANRS